MYVQTIHRLCCLKFGATPRITDTGSRYLKKKISLALIFRTFAAESVNILYIHDVGFYLNLNIFATWKSFS